MISITSEPLDITEALTRFSKSAAGAGAIVTFSGHVRTGSAAGDVECLHLQAYHPLTENGIRSAVETARSRWDLTAAQIIHRIGDMKPGDAIVFVATASKHRRAAFEAADFIMDYLKTEAVFWKKEVTASGANWVEPRQEDYRDQARWAEAEGN